MEENCRYPCFGFVFVLYGSEFYQKYKYRSESSHFLRRLQLHLLGKQNRRAVFLQLTGIQSNLWQIWSLKKICFNNYFRTQHCKFAGVGVAFFAWSRPHSAGVGFGISELAKPEPSKKVAAAYSVSDPYSSNPDPATNLNPDPERPRIRIRILAISLHYLKKKL